MMSFMESQSQSPRSFLRPNPHKVVWEPGRPCKVKMLQGEGCQWTQ
jgi:hypothetical protein